MNVPDSLMTTILKAWNFLYKRGFIEGFGHISARLPDNPELFILTRHSLGPRAVPEDFLGRRGNHYALKVMPQAEFENWLREQAATE